MQRRQFRVVLLPVPVLLMLALNTEPANAIY